MVSFDGKGAYEPRFGFNLESLLEVVFSEPVCHDEKSTLECARILLKHGARIDGLDSNGMAALSWTIATKPHWLGVVKNC
jgi:hypothetical protein